MIPTSGKRVRLIYTHFSFGGMISNILQDPKSISQLRSKTTLLPLRYYYFLYKVNNESLLHFPSLRLVIFSFLVMVLHRIEDEHFFNSQTFYWSIFEDSFKMNRLMILTKRSSLPPCQE